MWRTDTPWFDIAVVMSIFAVGNILFGHFEEHKPKMRRVLKVVLIVGVTAMLSSNGATVDCVRSSWGAGVGGGLCACVVVTEPRDQWTDRGAESEVLRTARCESQSARQS